MSTSSRLSALVVVGAMLFSGCAKQPVATAVVTADALTIVQGNLQAVQGGKELPQAVVLRVTSKTGAGIAGLPITLAVTAGGGSVDPASGISDSKGEVKAKWVLGASQPDQQITASSPGVTPVKLQATAILPSDIVIAQGNNQSAKAGSALTNSIVVRVVGPGNVPMQGITVGFQITAGGGAISPSSGVTSALGEVTAKWTLGAAAGINTALISASTASNVSIMASGTP